MPEGLATDQQSDEMAQWVKTLSTKSNDLGSIPRTHMVEGEN